MYIVSIFIAVINTLLNNHEKVNTSLAFIESQIFLPVLISRKNLSVTRRTQYGPGPSMGPTLQSVTMDVFMDLL